MEIIARIMSPVLYSLQSLRRLSWHLARVPQLVLTVVVAIVSITIFRADVWMDDHEIVGQWSTSQPGGNWLPAQLWSLSKWVGSGEAWFYRLWNVLALWWLSLTVLRVAEHFLSFSTTSSAWHRKRVALCAGLLVSTHPLVGMSACEIGNLDWQLTVLFSLMAIEQGWKFLNWPTAPRMFGIMLSLLFAALAAPAGLLLGLGGLWVVWHLGNETERVRVQDWTLAKTGWGTGMMIAAAALILSLGALLEHAWRHRSIGQGGEWSAHWLTQGRLFWVECLAVFHPTLLLPDHSLAWSEHWTDWPAVLGLLVVVLTSGFCTWKLSRPGCRPLIGLLLLTLLPTLLIFGWRTTHQYSEVRWYAVLPWVAILVAWALGWLLRRWPAMSLPLGWGLPLGLLFLSVGQTARFTDPNIMLAHILQAEPYHVRIRSFLQESEVTEGRLSAVLASSKPFADAYTAMQIANATNPFGRRYDLVNALRWWVISERRAQHALEHNYGLEYAQAFAENSTACFIRKVETLALTEPAALPLLASLASPAALSAPPKPRPAETILGIPGITADVKH